MDEIELSLSEAEAQVIRQKLNEYNFERVPNDNHQTLNLIVYGGDTLTGGLVGDTYWNWFYISLFWVDPPSVPTAWAAGS